MRLNTLTLALILTGLTPSAYATPIKPSACHVAIVTVAGKIGEAVGTVSRVSTALAASGTSLLDGFDRGAGISPELRSLLEDVKNTEQDQNADDRIQKIREQSDKLTRFNGRREPTFIRNLRLKLTRSDKMMAIPNKTTAVYRLHDNAFVTSVRNTLNIRQAEAQIEQLRTSLGNTYEKSTALLQISKLERSIERWQAGVGMNIDEFRMTTKHFANIEERQAFQDVNESAHEAMLESALPTEETVDLNQYLETAKKVKELLSISRLLQKFPGLKAELVGQFRESMGKEYRTLSEEDRAEKQNAFIEEAVRNWIELQARSKPAQEARELAVRRAEQVALIRSIVIAKPILNIFAKIADLLPVSIPMPLPAGKKIDMPIRGPIKKLIGVSEADRLKAKYAEALEDVVSIPLEDQTGLLERIRIENSLSEKENEFLVAFAMQVDENYIRRWTYIRDEIAPQVKSRTAVEGDLTALMADAETKAKALGGHSFTWGIMKPNDRLTMITQAGVATGTATYVGYSQGWFDAWLTQIHSQTAFALNWVAGILPM
ncbi:MAG TPA: hypothetical protein VM432_09575 [Bdellovibrionales bacterium]|nr:hypothetical protein [Bdellovibrionales bacterium]